MEKNLQVHKLWSCFLLRFLDKWANSRALGRRNMAFSRHCLHPGNSMAAAESRH